MSDSFEMLVDTEVSLDEAEPLSKVVIDSFRERGLIVGEPNSECVLGEMGYRPGPALAKIYQRKEREFPFWELLICGVEVSAGRDFNAWALGPACDGLVCPSCKAEIEPFDGALEYDKPIEEWTKGTGPALLACPKCHAERSITEWECKPPLGFGNLSITFWNWPRLDSPAWKMDLVAYFRQITGHAIIRTYGHI